MKVKILFFLLCIFIAVACDNNESFDDRTGKIKKMDGYIAGYDVCSITNVGETSESGGYYIVSDNLKDTLLTYNFPKDIYLFPSEDLSRVLYTPKWFPESSKQKYKVRITYRISSEEEKIYSVCLSNVLFLQNNAIQVIIESAVKN